MTVCIYATSKPPLEAAERLDEQRKLVFPGSVTLRYQDPVFSNAGNLLVTFDLVEKATAIDKTWASQ